jgi:hypothetical protein
MLAERCPQLARVPHQSSVTSKQSLTSAQRRLIDCFQRLNFGCIRALHFQDGEPLFEPPFDIVRTVKFSGDNRPRPELGVVDFPLKRALIEFFACLTELDTGIVEVVKIQHGMPVQMDVRDELRP